MPFTKRRKLSDTNSDDGVASQRSGEDITGQNCRSEDEPHSGSEGSSPCTEDEISLAKRTKSKKTLKRKRRATEPSQFGATLRSLLNTDAPSTLPLSLKPSLTRKRIDEKVELKARKLLQVEKREKEDNRRIRDVIGGWGVEGERGLRKVAQRGVVKLFNVIQQSQATASATVEKAKATRGTGKPSLPAPSADNKAQEKVKIKGKNLGGHRGDETSEEDDFFDMIRSGGVVSKT